MRCAQGQTALEEQKQRIRDKEQWHEKDIKWLKESLILLLAAKQKEISRDNLGVKVSRFFWASVCREQIHLKNCHQIPFLIPIQWQAASQ